MGPIDVPGALALRSFTSNNRIVQALQLLFLLLKAHAVGFKWFTFLEGLEGSEPSMTRRTSMQV